MVSTNLHNENVRISFLSFLNNLTPQMLHQNITLTKVAFIRKTRAENTVSERSIWFHLGLSKYQVSPFEHLWSGPEALVFPGGEKKAIKNYMAIKTFKIWIIQINENDFFSKTYSRTGNVPPLRFSRSFHTAQCSDWSVPLVPCMMKDHCLTVRTTGYRTS